MDTRRLACIGSLLIASLLAGVSLAEPMVQTVLDRVPADAHLVVLAPRIDTFDKHLAVLIENMKLPADSVGKDGLLGALKALGLKVGQVDRAGSLALMVKDAGDIEEIASQWIIVTAVKDYARFLKDNGVAKPADGANKIENSVPPLWAIESGGFVFLGPDKEIVTNLSAKPAKSLAAALPADQIETLLANDVSAHFDPKGLESAMVAASKMECMRAQAQQMMTMLGMCRMMTEEVQSLDLALKSEPAGVVGTVRVLGKAKSGFAKFAASAKTSKESLIRGVPMDNMILAVGVVSGVAGNLGMVGSFSGDVPGDKGKPEADGAGGPPMVVSVLAGAKDGKLSLPVAMGIVQRYPTEQAAADAVRTRAAASQPAAAAMFKIEQSTEKIDDLEISKTTMDLSAILPPMFAPMLKIIVGEEFAMRQGAKGVFGIMSVGGDTGCYRMMLSAAAADKPIDQYAVIAQVGKHLHASKAGEMYLMPSRIESLVRAAIPRFMPGQDGGATVLPDAPIGASWTFQGRALDIRVFVPMDLLAGFRKLGESMENTRVPAPRQPEGGPAAIPPPVF